MKKHSVICGEQIRQLRDHKKISLRNLSELSGISYTAIRNYENGVRAMDIDQIVALCRAMNKDPKEFLDECFELVIKEENEV